MATYPLPKIQAPPSIADNEALLIANGDLRLSALMPQIESLREHPGAMVREAAGRALSLAQNGTRVT